MEFHFWRIINLDFFLPFLEVLFYRLGIEDVRWLSWISRKHDFILAGCLLRFILLLSFVSVWPKNFEWHELQKGRLKHIIYTSGLWNCIFSEPIPKFFLPLFLPTYFFLIYPSSMRDGEKRRVKHSNRLLHIETLRSEVSFDPKDSKTVPLYVSTIKFYCPPRPGPGQQGKGRKRRRDILSPLESKSRKHEDMLRFHPVSWA